MKQKASIILTLCFFFVIIATAYAISGNKTIKKSTEWATGKIPVEPGVYDVIVVGSDPEGITAAIGAARSGGRTLLLGKEDGPGGLFTYGMLNTLDMNRNKEGVILSRGIFTEFYAAIGHTESFDVNKVKTIFTELIQAEKKLEYRPNYTFKSAILEDNIIKGVTMINKDGTEEKFYGKRVIDATQDGNVCAQAGVPYTIGMQDVNWSQNMAATLVFKVGGVKWEDIESDINRYKKETSDPNCGFNKSTAWGFGKWCYSKYVPVYSNMQLRGPNMGLQEDGTILINALQIFDVDGLSEESKKIALAKGKEEAENAVKYLSTKLKSFESAYLAGVADELYIRETRHIKGEYILKATDVLGNVNFSDKIALAAYPIDVQATSKNNTGYVIGSPNQYSIPLRCIVPLKIDNLFIVGKAASYSSAAAGSSRVVPTGMTVGESAGVTAIYTIYKNITPRQLLSSKSRIKQLTDILKNQNIYLPEFNYKDSNADVIGYKKIKKLINLGLLSGGYTNNFYFEKDASQTKLCNLLINVLQRGANEKYTLQMAQGIKNYYSDDNLTGGAAARICASLTKDYIEPGINPLTYTKEQKAEKIKDIEAEAWKIAKEKNYFSEEFGKDDVLTARQAFVISIDIVERILGREIDA